MVNQAKGLAEKGDYLAAKNIYQKLIADYTNSSQVGDWQKKSEELNVKLLFSPAITAKSTLYQIQPGDSLIKIARKFKTTPELIKKSNNLGDTLVPGKKIKVWTAPFSIIVDKSNNTLILKSDEEILKTYTVSTGKDNCTPVGSFKITNKIVNPTWFKKGEVIASADPKNALGSRWLGINQPGYGIHGTIEPEKLGRQVTEGCVRMSNRDVEELYIIVPSDTEVTIVD